MALAGGLSVDRLNARWQDVDPPEFQLIESIELDARGIAREAAAVELTARQYGDVAYAYGETALQGQKALVVLTADEIGGRIARCWPQFPFARAEIRAGGSSGLDLPRDPLQVSHSDPAA
jgi:hypothetical protein